MDITMDTVLNFLCDYLWICLACFEIGYLCGEHFGVKAYKKNTKYAAEPVPEKGWRCPKCGEPHQYYEKVCSCGVKIEDAVTAKDQASNTEAEKDDAFAAVLKYKNLLDNGILTQEEFDTKKKQLLNL